MKPIIHIEGETAHIDCIDPRSLPRKSALDWRCGNERCGEMNYDGIKYCRSCGFRRGERRSK